MGLLTASNDDSAVYQMAQAHAYMCKAGGTPALSYAMAGRLYCTAGNWVLLSVPNALVRGIFDTLHEPGLELPLRDGRLNAHITVMRPDEVEKIGGPDKITERGHTFHWTPGPLRVVEPSGWKDVSKCWFVEVRSPELEAFRKSYGLSPSPAYQLHLTVAIRRKNVLQHNETSKGASSGQDDRDRGASRDGGDIHSDNCPEAGSPASGSCGGDVDPPPLPGYLPDDEFEYQQAIKAAEEEKRAASAVGIPDRADYGDLSKLSVGQLVDFVRQRHKANRAGEHEDIRLGTPETGLFSWAARKGLPLEPGLKHLGVQQPVHSHEYKDFEGKIESGYGAGDVQKVHAGKVLITHVAPDEVHFTEGQARHPQRFVLKKTKDKDWLIINTTPTDVLPHDKVHYTKVSPEKAEDILSSLQEGSSVQAKIDGAASLSKLFGDKVEVLSYRASASGLPIHHTERVMHGKHRMEIPKSLRGTVLRGELYGVRDGKAIPPQELGGLLNSGVAKSIEDQRTRGITLKNMVFDIDDPAMRESTPYAQRLEKVREALEHLPKDTFHGPEEAKTPESALALLRKVMAGEHPLTEEGIVVHPPTGKPSKVKGQEEHDVHVVGTFPGEGKYKGIGAGGFTYATGPGGEEVGRVGTGFSDEVRKAMHEKPEDFVGRVARVKALGQFPGGALRGPSFVALHEDYPVRDKKAGAAAPVDSKVGEDSASSDVEGVVSYVPRQALDSVRRHGLLGGAALLANPEALAAAAKGRGVTVEALRADIERTLASWKKYQAAGPNVMFQPPPASISLSKAHPLHTLDLVPVSVRLRELLRAVPQTRVYGMELEPYDPVKHTRGGMRHHYLNKRTALRALLGTSADDLWRHYRDDGDRGYYAPDVPHASIHTPDGAIPPQYLGVPHDKKADLIPGGVADDAPDSDFPEGPLEEGVEHEEEHTTDPAIAKEVAKDHLKEEGPTYYKKLDIVEDTPMTKLKAVAEKKASGLPPAIAELLSRRRTDDSWRPRVRVMMPHGGPGKYLLEQLENRKYPENLGKRRFPGGGVDVGETMQEAAVRELAEELKLKTTLDKLKYIGRDPRPDKDYEHYFALDEHGLKPGWYENAIGGDARVRLVAGKPEGKRYFGAPVDSLKQAASHSPFDGHDKDDKDRKSPAHVLGMTITKVKIVTHTGDKKVKARDIGGMFGGMSDFCRLPETLMSLLGREKKADANEDTKKKRSMLSRLASAAGLAGAAAGAGVAANKLMPADALAGQRSVINMPFTDRYRLLVGDPYGEELPYFADTGGNLATAYKYDAGENPDRRFPLEIASLDKLRRDIKSRSGGRPLDTLYIVGHNGGQANLLRDDGAHAFGAMLGLPGMAAMRASGQYRTHQAGGGTLVGKWDFKPHILKELVETLKDLRPREIALGGCGAGVLDEYIPPNKQWLQRIADETGAEVAGSRSLHTATDFTPHSSSIKSVVQYAAPTGVPYRSGEYSSYGHDVGPGWRRYRPGLPSEAVTPRTFYVPDYNLENIRVVGTNAHPAVANARPGRVVSLSRRYGPTASAASSVLAALAPDDRLRLLSGVVGSAAAAPAMIDSLYLAGRQALANKQTFGHWGSPRDWTHVLPAAGWTALPMAAYGLSELLRSTLRDKTAADQRGPGTDNSTATDSDGAKRRRPSWLERAVLGAGSLGALGVGGIAAGMGGAGYGLDRFLQYDPGFMNDVNKAYERAYGDSSPTGISAQLPSGGYVMSHGHTPISNVDRLIGIGRMPEVLRRPIYRGRSLSDIIRGISPSLGAVADRYSGGLVSAGLPHLISASDPTLPDRIGAESHYDKERLRRLAQVYRSHGAISRANKMENDASEIQDHTSLARAGTDLAREVATRLYRGIGGVVPGDASPYKKYDLMRNNVSGLMPRVNDIDFKTQEQMVRRAMSPEMAARINDVVPWSWIEETPKLMVSDDPNKVPPWLAAAARRVPLSMYARGLDAFYRAAALPGEMARAVKPYAPYLLGGGLALGGLGAYGLYRSLFPRRRKEEK